MLKSLILLTILFCAQVCPAQSDNPGYAAAGKDAFVITRMIDKFHVQPRTVDDSFSMRVYDRLLDELDDEHIFFTREDIRKLSVYRLKLADQILQQKTDFLQLLTELFHQRLLQVDTMIDHVTAKPFNFTLKEKLTIAEDSSYPADLAAIHLKLYKLLKYSVGYRIASYAAEKGMPAQRVIDSLENVYRQKSSKSVRRSITRILKSPMSIEATIGTIYCQVISSSFDPHTNYFTKEEKTAFEGMLGNKTMGFGLSISKDDDGNPQIGKLKPGGPAFQSGLLHEGDKLISIQWDDHPVIEVVGASLSEVDAILTQEGGDKMTMIVRKSDGNSQQVSLHKQKLDTDPDEDKVKGFVLKGAKNVGYISLPAFYEDWENAAGVNGCANDVAKEIIKLKKENIGGLILDLRYNGGGSIQEAVELSGIFIDAGPVAQIKGRDPKVVTLKDVNRGTIYDGPLLLLVNGSSASASEMVAGTLKDYNRALIVGSPTYGKATTQVVLPMDTTIDMESYQGGSSSMPAYLKVTISRLYRVNGNTAQFSGVQPDILLPEAGSVIEPRESDEPAALAPIPIDANKYYRPLAPLPLSDLQATAKKIVDADPYYQQLAARAEKPHKENKYLTKDCSLVLDDMIKDWKARDAAEGRDNAAAGKDGAAAGAGTANGKDGSNGGKDGAGGETTVGGGKAGANALKDQADGGLFQVVNDAFEAKRLQTDRNLLEMNETSRKTVGKDPAIRVAYQLAIAMVK